MRLTDTKIVYDECVLYQVARYNMQTHCEELGGYIEKQLFHQLDENSWIGLNSYVYKCPLLRGKIIIGKNVTVVDSILNGRFFIKDDVVISGSNIRTRYYNCVIGKCAQIYNKTFVGTGTYEAKLFDDEYFHYQCYGTIDVVMTKRYCKVYCLTMTYEDAWMYLHNDLLWEQLRHKYQDTTPFQLFSEETRCWMREQCTIGLNKLRQG